VNKLEMNDLEHYIDLFTGFAFKSKKFNTDGNGVRLVRGDNVTEGKLRWGEKTKYWSDLTSDLDRYYLKENDILVSMDGSKVGKNFAHVKKADLPLLLVQRVACLRAKNGLLQDYLYILISSSRFKKYVDLIKTGTSIPHISGKQIKQFNFQLPTLQEQKTAISILKTMRDKIELNHQMNETLEQMAQSIFKSWFVDFEPFRDPEHEWYCEFEYNEELEKEIPKGWEVNTIGEIIDFNKRRSLAKKTKTIKVGMADIQEWKSQIENYSIEEFKGSGSKFENGDVLFARITPCLENGKTGIVNFLADDQIGFGSTEFIVLSPKEEINTAFIYSLTREENFRNNAINLMTGSSGRQRVDHKALSQWLFPLPNNIVVIQQYNKITKPFLQKMKLNNDQNKNLKALRDLLLPQLISGKLRIPDPEKFLEVIDT